MLLAAIAVAILVAVPQARASLPPQGVYEKCAPNSESLDCGARLEEIARAGFRYVLNYTAWFGTREEVIRYADQAQRAGIELIWPLNDPAWRNGTDLVEHYRYLGPGCDCSANDDFKRFALGLVKDHPATWGFYVGDEVVPTEDNVAEVAALSSEVGEIAPGKPTLYITLPMGGLIAQLQPFVPHASVAGTDYYPVGRKRKLASTSAVARTTRELTLAHGTQSALVLQSFSWSQYLPSIAPRFPSRREMRTMRDLAIAHGRPDLLLWYSYADVVESDHPARRWANLTAAAFAPYLRVRGVPSRRCARHRLRLGVRVRAAARVTTVRVRLDRRLVARSHRPRLRARLRLRRVRPGRHTIRIAAVDGRGHAAAVTRSFRRCWR